MKNKTVNSADYSYSDPPGKPGSDGATNDQPLTFNDLNLYMDVWYNKRKWIIAQISDELSIVKGRHLELAALDKRKPQSHVIHERAVNRWLRYRSRFIPVFGTGDN